MLCEHQDLDVPLTLGLVTQNEGLLDELIQQALNVTLIVGKALGFDLLRPVLKAPCPIRLTPEASE